MAGVILILGSDMDMDTLIMEVTGQDTIMVTMMVITGAAVTTHTTIIIMDILTTDITILTEEGRHGMDTTVQMRIRTVQAAQTAER